MHEVIEQALEFLGMIWRRRWLALAVAWVVGISSWGFIVLMPNTYTSSTRVYVDTANILQPLLRGLAVEVDIEAEVELMQRTLTSRPNLERVIRMTGLASEPQGPEELEALIFGLERNVGVVRAGRNLFAINYTHTDPEVARDVVKALLTIFVESHVGASRRDMDTAREFLVAQIEDYEQQLEAAETRLARYKQQNLALLYGQTGYQTRMETFEEQLSKVKAELRDARARRDTIKAELESIPEFNMLSTPGGLGPPSNTAVEILELESQLSEYLARYTEQHPDVVETRRRLDRLLAQQEAELALPFPGASPIEANGGRADAAAGYATPNPIYESLKISLIEEQAKISSLGRQVQDAGAQVDKLKQLAGRVPVVEAELKRLDRDYEILKRNYEALLARRESEKISRAREQGFEEIQFRVIEPPLLPVSPSGPARLLFFTAGLVFAVGAGLGIALTIGFLRNRITSVSELSSSFGLPVYGSISKVVSPLARRLAYVNLAAFGLCALMLLGGYAGLMLVEKQVGVGNLTQDEDWVATLQAGLLKTAESDGSQSQD